MKRERHTDNSDTPITGLPHSITNFLSHPTTSTAFYRLSVPKSDTSMRTPSREEYNRLVSTLANAMIRFSGRFVQVDRRLSCLPLQKKKMMRVEPVGNCVLGSFPRDPRAVSCVFRIRPD
jgi:hypothetical protein